MWCYTVSLSHDAENMGQVEFHTNNEARIVESILSLNHCQRAIALWFASVLLLFRIPDENPSSMVCNLN